MTAARPHAPARGAALAALALVVAAVHLWLGERVARLGLEAATHAGMTRRIEVAFVREMQPAEPPRPAAPPPTPVARRTRASPLAPSPAPPASAPAESPAVEPPAEPSVAQAPAEPASTPAAEPGPQPAEPVPAEPVATVAEGLPAGASASPAEPGPAFDWPASTRLSYRLTGNYRGPVEGQASVEWLREGQRYQVNLEVSIGPSFAPLMSRRMSSDGEVSPRGLVPRRYDEETKVVLRDPRRATVQLEAETVRLANGREAPRPEGVQDSASQFVQMTWLFTTQPHLLTRGTTIELPLALPRNLDRWYYDVFDPEWLDTPVGTLAAVHVKPRRAPRPGGDLTAEAWYAPSLHYLPVRIVIRQDEQTWIDLVVDRLPQQAAEAGSR